jgi:hypothetical protein
MNATVAVDGAGVLGWTHAVPAKMDGLAPGTLATLRMRLAPGEHDIRLFARLRHDPTTDPKAEIDDPLILVGTETCITIHEGAPSTVAAVLFDKAPEARIGGGGYVTMGVGRGAGQNVGSRFDVR